MKAMRPKDALMDGADEGRRIPAAFVSEPRRRRRHLAAGYETVTRAAGDSEVEM